MALRPELGAVGARRVHTLPATTPVSMRRRGGSHTAQALLHGENGASIRAAASALNNMKAGAEGENGMDHTEELRAEIPRRFYSFAISLSPPAPVHAQPAPLNRETMHRAEQDQPTNAHGPICRTWPSAARAPLAAPPPHLLHCIAPRARSHVRLRVEIMGSIIMRTD